MKTIEQKAKKVPTIRFAGFDDEWVEKKLDDISDVRDGTHASPLYKQEGYPFVTSKNVKDGSINYDDIQYISKEDYDEINKRSKVDVNDILMGMIGTIGNLALVRTEPSFAIKNVALIKDTQQVFFLYLYHYLQSWNIIEQLSLGMDGGTQKFIALNKIRELNICIPSNKEQQKTGLFLESVSALISLEQKKYDKLTQVKKSMLEKMFPKEGAAVPEIRFAGFTGDWGKDSLDKLAIISKGCQINKSKLNKTGKYYVLNGGMSPSGFTDSFNTTGGTISISEGGNSCGFVMYNKHDFWSGGHNYTLSQLKLNGIYFYHFLKMREPFIMSLRVGSGLPNIQKSRLSEIIIFYPTESEQQKIGSYFSHLDSLISLQQRKLEKLKNIKKSLLEKMFV